MGGRPCVSGGSRSEAGLAPGRPRSWQDDGVQDHITINDHDGVASMTFGCGTLPVDAAITAAGHEPNGYFWEGVTEYVAPELAAQIVLDCEGDAFYARGDRALLDRLRGELAPYLVDSEKLTRLIADATATGFRFDD